MFMLNIIFGFIWLNLTYSVLNPTFCTNAMPVKGLLTYLL